mgnify:CR=1 FL=1
MRKDADFDISDTIEQKIESVKCYASQFVGKSAHVPEMVRTITEYFGTRIGTFLSEARARCRAAPHAIPQGRQA